METSEPHDATAGAVCAYNTTWPPVPDAARKRDYIKSYIPEIGIALQEILGLSDPQRSKVMDSLADVLERSRKL